MASVPAPAKGAQSRIAGVHGCDASQGFKGAKQSRGLSDIGLVGEDAEIRRPGKAAKDRRRVVHLLQTLERVTSERGGRLVPEHAPGPRRVPAPDDEPRVVSVVDRAFAAAKRPDAQPAPVIKPNGYRATHRLVIAPDTPDDLSIRGAICEVQITTLAAHLYNELEHDIAYKEDRGEHTTSTEHALRRELLGASLIADRLAKLLLA